MEVCGTRKLDSLSYVVYSLCDPVFSRFSRTPTCDRHRTDRHGHSAMACACIASRSKSLRRSMPISIRLFVSVFFNLITVRLSSAFCECVIIASYLFNTPIPQNTPQNENRNMKIGT